MVTVYSKNNCMQCRMVKKFLNDKGVEFTEINIDEQPDKIDYLKALNYSTVPVTFFGEQCFAGFAPTEIRKVVDYSNGK